MKYILLTIIIVFGFYGCGGGGSSNVSTSEPDKKVAYFYDSVVDGLEYTWSNCDEANRFNNNPDSPHYTGSLNGSGSFFFQDECTISFKIGKIILGDIEGKNISNNSKIFPTNILGLNTTDTSDVRLTNLLRFLQSLDEDNDPLNGIIISKSIRDNLSASSISAMNIKQNSSISENDLNTTVVKANSSKRLVSITSARSHFDLTLKTHVNPNLDTIKPATPFLINEKNEKTTLEQIKTFHTKERVVQIYGEAGTKILKAVNHTGSTSNLNFIDTGLIMGEDWKQKVPLTFDNDNETHFHKFIVLEDSSGKRSDILHLDIVKDFTPPHVKDAIVTDRIFEEQTDFTRNINVIDTSDISSYQLVSNTKDSRSIDYNKFSVDSSGNIRFNSTPNFDDLNSQKAFQLVARALDRVGNTTDVLVRISVKNLLDNPPILKNNQTEFNATLIEKPAPNSFVADLNLSLEDNLTKAPDNNISISNFFHYRLLSHTNIFEVNRTTGKLTVKDENSSLLDFEHYTNPNNTIIPLRFAIENNNTNQEGDPNNPNETNATLNIKILNKLDTTPSLLPEIISPIDEQSSLYNNSAGYIIATLDKNLTASKKDFVDFDFNFSIIGGNDGNFSIVPTTGELKVVTKDAGSTYPDGVAKIYDYESSLDFESKPEYNLTIRAINFFDDNSDRDYNDSNNKTIHSFDLNITIRLRNVVDKNPVIIAKDINRSFPESILANTRIAQLDVNGTFPDENVTSEYKIFLYVRTTDNKDLYNIIVGSENAAYQPDFAKVPFELNSTTGRLKTSRTLLAYTNPQTNDFLEDANGSSYNYLLRARGKNTWWDNSVHFSNDADVAFTVSNVIDIAPKIKTPSPNRFEVNESEPSNGTFTIYTIEMNGTLYDENNVSRYEIVGNRGPFDINQSTGRIFINQALDWESDENHTIQFRAVNRRYNGTEQFSQTKTIQVLVQNITEVPPLVIAPSEITIHENISENELLTIIGTTTSTDKNDTDKKVITGFQIISGNDNNFSIDSTPESDPTTNLPIGKLKTVSNVALDFENNSTYTLDINVSNDVGLFTIHSIRIKVLDDIESNLPLLIIPVEYDDVNLTVTDSELNGLIFGTTFKRLNHYFFHISQTKFRFQPANETRGDNNDGVVRVRLSGKSHPNSISENDLRLALYDVNSSVNFASFDRNSDGNITKEELQIVFIIAGGEKTYGDTNKSVKATVGTFNTIDPIDGVNVAKDFNNQFDRFNLNFDKEDGNYVVIGEKNGENLATLGLMVHNLGHTALNFPYLLDIQEVSNGIGYFGLMGYGYRGHIQNEATGSTPVNISAYNIISQGWVHPRTITTTTRNIKLVPSNKGNGGFNIVKIPIDSGNNPKKYYLIENRVKTDAAGYDDGFFGMENKDFVGGLAIWKVNEDRITQGNSNVNNKLVDLIEYDEDTGLDTRQHFGKTSSLYHVNDPTYPNISEFNISNSSLDSSDNSMTIDITIP